MKKWAGKKILWIYDDRDHLTNPILVQAINTLISSRNSIYVVDNSAQSTKSTYIHIPLKRHGLIVNTIRNVIKKLSNSKFAVEEKRASGNHQSTILSLY